MSKYQPRQDDIDLLFRHVKDVESKVDFVAKEVAKIEKQNLAIAKILASILATLRNEEHDFSEAVRIDTAVNTPSPYIK